ncbi:MAG: hypothetical protein JXA96_00995 [Sedimentisphaerales bacterium]|nr:hypothetical protein [Sedimentisphaerales bacterium]
MKKINRIKLIFAALPVIVIALLLIIPWNQYDRSYKTLAQWGKGKMGVSETAYYNSRIRNIVTKWQEKGDNNGDSKDPNTSFMHIDLEQNALWLEENGKVNKENYMNLPENISWQLSCTASLNQKLPDKIILRAQKSNSENIKFFFIVNSSNTNILKISERRTDKKDSLFGPEAIAIVSEDEYKSYKDSLAQMNSEQSIEKENSEQTALEKNKLRWLEAEKLIYMEIEGQIINAGYELASTAVGAGPDYTSAYAVINANVDNILYQYLDFEGRAYLKIDYLGDEIWYAKTVPDPTQNPTQKPTSDLKHDFEFLIFPDEQISRSQYMKYIKQGHKLHQSEKYRE